MEKLQLSKKEYMSPKKGRKVLFILRNIGTKSFFPILLPELYFFDQKIFFHISKLFYHKNLSNHCALKLNRSRTYGVSSSFLKCIHSFLFSITEHFIFNFDKFKIIIEKLLKT